MRDSDYTVMIGPPGPSFGWGTVQGLLALTNSRHTVKFVHSGNGWDDFDHLWVEALNASEAGLITHFAMLHLDVSPKCGDGEPVWLDTLIGELDRLDLDMVSAVIPLKSWDGITSSGIGDPENPWSPYRRIAIRELPSLPDTFNATDLGYPGFPLLHNTGCWVADLRKPVFHVEDADGTCGAYFGFPQRVHRDKLSKRWVLARESEDWFFSRCLHKLKANTAVTKKVRLTHKGVAEWKNWDAWGSQEHDEATSHRWAVPRGPWDDIHGWFDFADLYAEQVAKAENGSHFVEVGSWLGKSAVFMATKIRESGKAIRLDCVDNWTGGYSEAANGMAAASSVATLPVDVFAEFNANLARCGVEDLVTPLRSDSTAAAERYDNRSLDFVFLDADHGEAAVSADLWSWWPKVKIGGTLAGHDFNEEGPKKAVEKFAAECGLSVRKACRSFVIEKR